MKDRSPGSASRPFGHTSFEDEDLNGIAPVPVASDSFQLDLAGELFDDALAANNFLFVRDLLERSSHDEALRSQLGWRRIANARQILKDLEAA